MEAPQQQQKKKRRWFIPVIFLVLISSFLILIIFSTFSRPVTISLSRHHARTLDPRPSFVESKLRVSKPPPDPIPRLAYLISGSRGDGESLKRVLKTLYHPWNQYVVHLDLEAPAAERMELKRFVTEEPLFKAVGNVRVIVRANLVTYRGPTMVSNTLHAASLLLKEGGDWDWFINLSASDYPLVTQDDLLHTLSTIPRDLNFLEHTSDIGWKEWGRARPLLIDPGLYSLQKSDVFWVTETRGLPTQYRLFTGSAWMMLSRPFIEYSLWGWDNLPRIVLMYYANFLSTPEGYFHTVICNADDFRNTTVNHDLHFIAWDNPPRQHPHYLTIDDYEEMVKSNAPFARKFKRNEPLLDKIDSELLGPDADGFIHGGWFSSDGNLMLNARQNVTKLRPGPGAQRLKQIFNRLLSTENFRATQCA